MQILTALFFSMSLFSSTLVSPGSVIERPSIQRMQQSFIAKKSNKPSKSYLNKLKKLQDQLKACQNERTATLQSRGQAKAAFTACMQNTISITDFQARGEAIAACKAQYANMTSLPIPNCSSISNQIRKLKASRNSAK